MINMEIRKGTVPEDSSARQTTMTETAEKQVIQHMVTAFLGISQIITTGAGKKQVIAKKQLDFLAVPELITMTNKEIKSVTA